MAKESFLRTALVLVGICLSMFCGCTNFVANRSNADGVALFQQQRYQEALVQFQAATYSDPNNADGYYNLGATYHRLARMGQKQSECLSQAETSYRQCLVIDPNHRDCHRGLAVLLIEENRAPEAFASLQNWATQAPSLADPRIELARLYEEHQNPTAAADMLAEAVQRNPNDPRCWAAMGKVREETGDNTRALADYQHSLGINPNQPDVSQRVVALQATLSHQPLALPAPPGAASPAGAPSPILAGQPPAATR